MARPSNPELVKKIQHIVAEELQTKSLNSITMRSIAKKAGITPTTIYYYFKSKGDLLDNIKYSATGEFSDFIIRQIETVAGTNLKNQLAVGVRAFMEWVITNPALADLIFEKLPPKLDLEPDVMMSSLYRGPLKILEIMQRGMEEGEIPPRDCALDISIFQGMLYGVAKTWLNKRTFPQFWEDIEPLTQRMLEIIELTLETPEKINNRRKDNGGIS